jgi:peptidoglycan hydrolase-like protein with peptidoglycan-binding domain
MSDLKKGSSGAEVKALQDNLKKLGFAIDADGIFGDKTHNSVITLQTVFGYDVDGIAGAATQKLAEQQVGYGWSLVAARKAFNKDAAAV